MLDSNGRLPHSLLDAGYDKYSAYDLAWQSLHMAAAAACRGSTASGGSGSWDNQVMTRNTADKKTCAWICAQTAFHNCDAEVSIYGKKGKATQNGMTVGWFYNYGCNYAANGGSEASSSDETVWNKGVTSKDKISSHIRQESCEGTPTHPPLQLYSTQSRFFIKPSNVSYSFSSCAQISRNNRYARGARWIYSSGAPHSTRLIKDSLPRSFICCYPKQPFSKEPSFSGRSYSAYDLAWQSLHMAAAAACRGSTASGGSGSKENKVMTRNTADRKTCAQICAQTAYRNCDAEVSIYGNKARPQ
ncbi:unnamed protein product [Porites evermanni]|uniref:SCP domain-containing protein n=1 Tax=Porites evermanni TaxID=104178 RepID=A0ABN8LSV1_9CNID|nr:unnamed protein product [Porites evermanni]